MIEVDGLTKYFGLTKALDDISFEVHQGEILGFLGPNGAGKTTTMRVIAGLIIPSSGRVAIGGLDVNSAPLEARRKIGYLPESVPLYRDLRVSEYLRYVAALKGVSSQQRDTHIRGLVQRCGLEKVTSRLIGHLSKGFRQRVGLAQALIGDPEVLILDEPTEGLDPKQIIEIRQLIGELAGSRTVILSTHILPEVSMTCERVIILNKGKLVAVDSPGNLNRRLQKNALISLSARGPERELTDVLQRVPGAQIVEFISLDNSQDEKHFRIESDTSDDIRSRIAHAVITAGYDLTELHSESLSLEEIFVQLVTEEEEVA